MVAKVSPAEETSDSVYSHLCVRSADLPFLLIFYLTIYAQFEC